MRQEKSPPPTNVTPPQGQIAWPPIPLSLSNSTPRPSKKCKISQGDKFYIPGTAKPWNSLGKIHIVKWGETLKMLAPIYKTTPEKICQVNPQLIRLKQAVSSKDSEREFLLGGVRFYTKTSYYPSGILSEFYIGVNVIDVFKLLGKKSASKGVILPHISTPPKGPKPQNKP